MTWKFLIPPLDGQIFRLFFGLWCRSVFCWSKNEGLHIILSFRLLENFKDAASRGQYQIIALLSPSHAPGDHRKPVTLIIVPGVCLNSSIEASRFLGWTFRSAHMDWFVCTRLYKNDQACRKSFTNAVTSYDMMTSFCILTLSWVIRKLLRLWKVLFTGPWGYKRLKGNDKHWLSDTLRQCLGLGHQMGMSENGVQTPNEIAIFHRGNDQQNHWVFRGTQHFQTTPDSGFPNFPMDPSADAQPPPGGIFGAQATGPRRSLETLGKLTISTRFWVFWSLKKRASGVNFHVAYTSAGQHFFWGMEFQGWFQVSSPFFDSSGRLHMAHMDPYYGTNMVLSHTRDISEPL